MWSRAEPLHTRFIQSARRPGRCSSHQTPCRVRFPPILRQEVWQRGRVVGWLTTSSPDTPLLGRGGSNSLKFEGCNYKLWEFLHYSIPLLNNVLGLRCWMSLNARAGKSFYTTASYTQSLEKKSQAGHFLLSCCTVTRLIPLKMWKSQYRARQKLTVTIMLKSYFDFFSPQYFTKFYVRKLSIKIIFYTFNVK